MARYLLLLYLFIVFNSCSTTQSLLKKRDYAEVINETIFRLSCNAQDKRAGQLLQKAYGDALVYYQNEIDRILTSNDQFRWTKTLDVMLKTNDLADEIRYNSVASQLICEPKIYTSEIIDVRQKAVVELYEAGTDLLTRNTKEKAKDGYFYLLKAGKLDPEYKDVRMKIQEAKNRATWKVIIEPVPAHTQNNGLSFSTKSFYQTLFYKLREEFSYHEFVNFYSPEEAEKQKVENPDQIVQIEISNFEMIPHRYLASKNIIIQPSKKLELIDGKYVWINVEPVNSGPEPEQHRHEYTRLDMKSSVDLNIKSLSENKTIYKYRMSWNYFEELGYSNFSFIDQTYISISPDNQIFFDHFSLSLCDQVVLRLCDFFKPYNQ
jgi:hypothetical protein